MMKKAIVFTMLVVGFVTNNALADIQEQLVKLPSKAVLEKRLHENCLDVYDEKMKLSDKFADRELYSLGVNLALELALHDFCEEYPDADYSSKITPCFLARLSKDHMLRALLQDHPKAISELKERGIIKS